MGWGNHNVTMMPCCMMSIDKATGAEARSEKKPPWEFVFKQHHHDTSITLAVALKWYIYEKGSYSQSQEWKCSRPLPKQFIFYVESNFIKMIKIADFKYNHSR